MAHQQNRRHSERHSSSALIYVAPVDAAGTIRWDETQAVSCQDLSKGGISFHMQTSPGWQQLVVALGDKEHGWLQVRSEVIYCTPAADGGYLVGCKFVERLTLARPFPETHDTPAG